MKNSVKHKHHFWCPGNYGRWVKKGEFFPFLCGRGHGLTPYNISELSSVHFSDSVVSDSLWPHESQHARPPCPSPTPRVHSDSHPSSPWCHPAISSSVVPCSSHLQSFPASGSFQMSQFFAMDGQSIGVSTSTSVLPMNTQDWPISFRMD